MIKRYKKEFLIYLFMNMMIVFLMKPWGIDIMFGKVDVDAVPTPFAMMMFLSYLLPLIYIEFLNIYNYINVNEKIGMYFAIRDENCKHIIKRVIMELSLITLLCLLIKLVVVTVGDMIMYQKVIEWNDIVHLLNAQICIMTHSLIFFVLWRYLLKKWLFAIYLIIVFILYFCVFFTMGIPYWLSNALLATSDYILIYIVMLMLLFWLLKVTYKKRYFE